MSTVAATTPGTTHADRIRRRTPSGGNLLGPVAWALLLATTIAVVGVLPTTWGSAPSRAASASTVRVAASDTLWAIAKAHPLAGASTAATVEAISRMNGLESAKVAPGTVLKVPASVANDTAFAQLDRPQDVR